MPRSLGLVWLAVHALHVVATAATPVENLPAVAALRRLQADTVQANDARWCAEIMNRGHCKPP